MKATVNLEGLHRLSSFHRRAVLKSGTCGCFFCLETFRPREITEWIDKRRVSVKPLPHVMTAKQIKLIRYHTVGQTALCPRCSIDSVIPDSFGFRVTKKLLAALCKRWFGRVRLVEKSRNAKRRATRPFKPRPPD